MTEERLARIQRRVLGVILKEMQGWVNELTQGMMSPDKILSFMRSMGFDPSQLPGMLAQQVSFDPYQVLGLDKSATDEEVKHRYRELVHMLHPDKSGTPGTNFMFRIVLAAYEMIMQKRRGQ